MRVEKAGEGARDVCAAGERTQQVLFVLLCLFLSAFPFALRLQTGTLPRTTGAGELQPPPPAPLWHPTMPHIPATIPAWAYGSGDGDGEALPGRFLDPITNLTGPLVPPPAPHASVNGWPTAKAQGFEDVFAIDTFFHGLERPGYIAECGALDGLQFSTTWLFTFVYGWRAVHIEASPKNFGSLSGRSATTWGGRTESLNFNAALCSSDVEGKEGYLHYAEKPTARAMPIDGIWEFMAPDYRATWWSDALANASMVEEFAIVHCASLDSLLAPFAVPFLDLWVVDVEGGELSVLQSHDFEALPVNVLCVEADEFNPAKNAAVRAFLETKGFAFHSKMPYSGNPQNDWFVHSSFTPAPRVGF